MKKIFKLFILGLLVLSYGCEEDQDVRRANYVTFEDSTLSFQIAENATGSFDVTVYTGNTVGTDRNFSLEVDPSSTITVPYNVPSSVTVPAGSNEGTFTVTATDNDDLKYVAQDLVINFVDEADLSTGSSVTLKVTELCAFTQVRFSLTLDTWPDETTWSVTDSAGNVLDSGGPYINPDDDFVTYTFDYCLDSGDYTVTVNDAYGDGGPTFTVIVDGNIVVDTAVSGTGTSAGFTVD